jgi:hypothetical protein
MEMSKVRLCLEFDSKHELALWYSKASAAGVMTDLDIYLMDNVQPDQYTVRRLGDELFPEQVLVEPPDPETEDEIVDPAEEVAEALVNGVQSTEEE